MCAQLKMLTTIYECNYTPDTKGPRPTYESQNENGSNVKNIYTKLVTITHIISLSVGWLSHAYKQTRTHRYRTDNTHRCSTRYDFVLLSVLLIRLKFIGIRKVTSLIFFKFSRLGWTNKREFSSIWWCDVCRKRVSYLYYRLYSPCVCVLRQYAHCMSVPNEISYSILYALPNEISAMWVIRFFSEWEATGKILKRNKDIRLSIVQLFIRTSTAISISPYWMDGLPFVLGY